MRATLDARSMITVKLFRMLGPSESGLFIRGVVSEASSLASSRSSVNEVEEEEE